MCIITFQEGVLRGKSLPIPRRRNALQKFKNCNTTVVILISHLQCNHQIFGFGFRYYLFFEDWMFLLVSSDWEDSHVVTHTEITVSRNICLLEYLIPSTSILLNVYYYFAFCSTVWFKMHYLAVSELHLLNLEICPLIST